MFYDNLFFDFIQIIYRYYKWLYDEHYDFIEWHNEKAMQKNEPAIVIPCNMSFCEDDEKIEKVKYYYNLFQKIGVTIYFSYSTDGKYATDIREQKYVPDEFFDKVFALCQEMNWGVHPMISYESIDNIINNYEWFKGIFNRYRLNNGSSIPYFLEVRNDGWNEESLEKYQKFLQYYVNDMFHMHCNSNLEVLFNEHLRIFSKNERNSYTLTGSEHKLHNLLIMSINNIVSCNIGTFDLCINMGDLSLLPCHRTAYPELRGGEFHIENDKITGIKAYESYNSYLNLIYFNGNYRPGCVTCDYNVFCMKGCLGAQYEKFGDPNIPILSVCTLLKTKLNTLMNYYHSIGLFHWLFQTEPKYPSNKAFQDLLIKIGYTEYEIYTELGDFSNNDNRNSQIAYGSPCGS